MVSLDDLSAELLLNIASCLGDYSRPPRTRQQDLCSLSLTARRYRNISQEILHQWITLQPPKLMSTDKGRIILSPPGPPRVAKLARTLVERPDLAQKARCLDLFLVWHAPSLCNASGVCPRRHTCGWDDVVSSCEEFLDSPKCAWASWQALSRWRRRIYPGSYGQEYALAGIVLASTPALEELNIRSYSWRGDSAVKAHLAKGGGYDLPLDRFCPSNDHFASDFFDDPTDGLISTLDLAVVPGLAKLKYLRTNGLSSWDFVTLKGLQSFHCTLHSGSLDFNLNLNHGSRKALSPTLGAGEPQITKLYIETLLTILNQDEYILQERIEYLRGQLLPKLPMLKHLSLRLVTRSGWKAHHYYTVAGIEYERLVSMIPALNLETLIIDTTEACEEDFSHVGLLRAIQPAHSLAHFTKLRRLVAPQELFFPVYSNRYPDFFTCELPSSIMSIEVLDSTVAMKKYAKHLYDNMTSLPDFNTLVGWRDREEHHLAPDNRLKPDVAPMLFDMSTWEDHCRDWGRFWAVNNSVWSHIEEAGVRVDWKPSHARGWREI